MRVLYGKPRVSPLLSVFLLSSFLVPGFGFPITNVRIEEPHIWGNEIVHEGDLIVGENRTFLIENCTFTVEGIVVVRDNATLTVRDAQLNVSACTLAGMVIARNNGALIMEGGELNLHCHVDTGKSSPARICDVDVTDTATLKIENTKFSSKLGSIKIRVKRKGKVILSSIGTCEGSINAFDDSAVSIRESLIFSIKLSGNSSCVVQDTDIQYFSGSERFTASFYNSTIGGIHFIFGSSSKAVIEKLLQGFHRYWDIHANLTVEGVEYNMTLHDTTVTGLLRLGSVFNSTGMELHVFNQNLWSADIGKNSELDILNCTIKYLFCGRPDSVYSIVDSEIDRLILGDNAFVSISETRIEQVELSHFKGALVCDNVTLNKSLEVEFGVTGSQFYLCGGLRFGANFSTNEGQIYEGPSYRVNFTSPIQKFEITRGYQVVTRQDRRPLENVQLSLYNEENQLIWEGTTDGNGEAEFNMTYYRNWILPPGYYHTNHTNTFRLIAAHGQNNYTTELGLLSDTPITFNFPKSRPLWTTWQFLIGISILTIAAILAILYFYPRS
jgi:hypothetical protein